ncbi:hypothetical protein BAY15_2761 [Stenotrophomonas rhizophila]|jgi:hypothetical protein|nr:hypothetical protein BAY15_2761 [Stenotrophomonas rhizophila]
MTAVARDTGQAEPITMTARVCGPFTLLPRRSTVSVKT